jgi:hypothetical protein
LKKKLALNGINRSKDTLTGQRLECNEEAGQQDSETGEHSNLEQQIQRRSYTGYRGLWKKGSGGGGSGKTTYTTHKKKKSLNRWFV